MAIDATMRAMRPILTILRRMLRIARWLALGISTLLLVGTMALWARGIGHEERWGLDHFESRWTTGPLAGTGIARRYSAWSMRGHFGVGCFTQSPAARFESEPWHSRNRISADEALRTFESFFQPRHRLEEQKCFDRAWRCIGIGFRHGRDPIDPETGLPLAEDIRIAIPFWMLAVVFGLWPSLVVLRRLVQRKHHAPGLCQNCGYDLRATPDRCPECGTVSPSAGRRPDASPAVHSPREGVDRIS